MFGWKSAALPCLMDTSTFLLPFAVKISALMVAEVPLMVLLVKTTFSCGAYTLVSLSNCQTLLHVLVNPAIRPLMSQSYDKRPRGSSLEE